MPAAVMNARGVTAAQAFAAWLQRNEPALFNALALEASRKASGLGDWSSILSSIGSGVEDVGSSLSDAASAVGDYLTSPQGMNSLATLAGDYLQTQESQQVTQLQVARASQGLPPAPVTYSTNAAGQVVPVYTGGNPPAGATPLVLGNGATGYQLSAAQVSALSGGGGFSAFLQRYGLPLALAGGGLLVLALVMKRR